MQEIFVQEIFVEGRFVGKIFVQESRLYFWYTGI